MTPKIYLTHLTDLFTLTINQIKKGRAVWRVLFYKSVILNEVKDPTEKAVTVVGFFADTQNDKFFSY